MTLYLSQKCWGRSCLHLAAALRAGHWRWHLAGIGREMYFTRPLTRGASATAGGRVSQGRISDQDGLRTQCPMIVCVHPDKAGGNLMRKIQLNDTWGKISRRFKEHGHELC